MRMLNRYRATLLVVIILFRRARCKRQNGGVHLTVGAVVLAGHKEPTHTLTAGGLGDALVFAARGRSYCLG